MDDESIKKQGAWYKFFYTVPFLEEDDLIGMWSRIFYIVEKEKPNIIILDLHKPDMVNENEMDFLRNFGIVLKLSHAG